MLDITTSNQQAPTSATGLNYCGYGLADDLDLAAELLDDDMMDPLFDEDWLHENNLDILFDLFEEEIESKVGVESANSASATAATHLFGTSPVTSYLFGTSPSLASTLDLLYLDNNNQPQQQQQQQPSLAQQSSAATNVAAAANIGAKTLVHSAGSTSATISHTSTTISNKSTTISNKSTTTTFNFSVSKAHTNAGHHHKVGGGQRVSVSGPKMGSNVNSGANGSSPKATNAMRIKRGLKRGDQSEGISLLAKPISARKAYGGSVARAVLREHSYAARAH